MMQKKPNILFVVTDQQRRDTVGAYGSTVCKTPNMDRLAAGGMCFDWAFTPTGLCSPVRASLLCGLYAHSHKVLTNVSLHPIRESLPMSADRMTPALKDAGYNLGFVGKWHVNETETPADFGYDPYYSLGDYRTWRLGQGLDYPEVMQDFSKQIAARDTATPEQSRPAWLCDRAIELIDSFSGQDAPFLVQLNFQGPHFPNVVPEPYFSLYDPAAIEPWPNFDDSLAGKPAVQAIKKRHWQTDGMSWADWQPLVSAYFGEITLIDAQVGRVLDHLDAAGLSEDTLVIWTTDHGDTMGSHGISNKDYTMYEEIYRVPLIMRWPGTIPAGARSDHFVHHFLDLNATIVDLAGGDTGAPSHGRSLMPVFAGDTPEDWPQEAYCEFHGSHMGLYSMRLLRDRRYSYIYHPNDIDEFYDHQSDPHQLHNLAENPGEARAILQDMKRRMVSWMAATDDHLHNEWTALWLTDDAELAKQAPGRRNKKW